jgi:COP9 signalosome complex subunit 2
MSDDEYEYEYDDDASMQEEDQFEYTDEEEPANDAEVALENAYYQSKGLRETDIVAAAASFESVISLEQERLSSAAASSASGEKKKKYGPWSYKAMKQLVKLHLRAGNASAMIQNYHRLLQCIAQGDVSPNQIEKGIHGMLERVASLYQGGGGGGVNSSNSNNKNNTMMDPQKIALQVYDATLKEFHPKTGTCQNERLWFKTNIKYGQLLYEMNETAKLQQVLHELQTVHSANKMGGGGGDAMNDASGGAGGGGSASSSSSSSTQSMEIYALQIQLYSQLKDHKRLRHTFHKAMAVRGGLPHPRTLALIQELGGKMVRMYARSCSATVFLLDECAFNKNRSINRKHSACMRSLMILSHIRFHSFLNVS